MLGLAQSRPDKSSMPSVAMAADLVLMLRIMGLAPWRSIPPQQGRWGARVDHPILMSMTQTLPRRRNNRQISMRPLAMH